MAHHGRHVLFAPPPRLVAASDRALPAQGIEAIRTHVRRVDLVGVQGPDPSATITRVTALVAHRDLVDSRPPAVPPEGPVDVGLGLLLARTAGPLGAKARAALIAYFATADPAPVRVGAQASGLSTAQVRTWVGQAARLASIVGPPRSLLDAFVLLGSRAWLAGDATNALVDARLTADRIHPTCALRLGCLYRLPDIPQTNCFVPAA
jgi:hypothetical protein